MAKFSVHVDVTFSGNVEIEANDEQDAIATAQGMSFLPCDIKNFYFLETQIVDVDNLEEV